MPTTNNDKLGLLGTVTELNNAIHDGKAYSFDVDGTLLLTSSMTLMGRVVDKEVHFHELEGEFQKGAIRITLYEAPTTTADGTLITAHRNMNRNYSDASNMLLYSEPTVTDTGSKVASAYAPLTGGGANTQPSQRAIAGGRVLKKNTDYLIVIENLDNADCTYGIDYIWSEHDESTI